MLHSPYAPPHRLYNGGTCVSCNDHILVQVLVKLKKDRTTVPEDWPCAIQPPVIAATHMNR